MFTGLVDDIGTIDRVATTDAGLELRIRCRYDDVVAGESIAVNGACLTVRDGAPGSFTCAAVSTTLAVTTIGSWKAGRRVNLERAVRPTDRLGGHIVQGHVDARGKFISAAQNGDFWTVRIGFPEEIGQYLVYKGSISVEGISLTVADLADEYFEIAVIPKTWELTNLSTLKAGDEVNLEADVIAKYVERIMLYGKAKKGDDITMEKLEKLGFL